MNTTYAARKVTLTDSFKERAELKLKKLDKFFDDAKAQVTVSTQKNQATVELTVWANNLIFRSEAKNEDKLEALDEALEAYHAMRAVEGRKLAEDIGNRLTYIENYTSQVEQRSPETVTEYRAKLTARMEEVLQSTTIDPQRILQEAAIYADKVAVDEETVRLRSHVAQLRTMLESDEPMGRKMDFLIQEVNRESNTIGSKCCDVAIAQVVVGLKAEVEKMREQVQNVE